MPLATVMKGIVAAPAPRDFVGAIQETFKSTGQGRCCEQVLAQSCVLRSWTHRVDASVCARSSPLMVSQLECLFSMTLLPCWISSCSAHLR